MNINNHKARSINEVPENRSMIISRAMIIITEIFEYFILWMFFAIIFERLIVMKKAIIPERIITAVIVIRFEIVRFGRSLETATAAPVLVL